MQKSTRCFLCISLLISFYSTASAQFSAHASLQMNTLPTLRVNSDTYQNGTAQGIQMLVRSPDVELGLHLFRGYDPAIDFSYGVSMGLPFATINDHQFKVGIQLERFFIDDYKMNRNEIGGIIEDDITDAFGPYAKWEWVISDLLSLYTKAGYRIMRSDVGRVTDISYGTNPVTGEKTQNGYQAKHSNAYYGSGFELGVGLSILLY